MATHTKKPNILIVGAGPTGLTTALELARRGMTPTVIEKKLEPSPLSRAVGILPSSMAIFKHSGVAEKLRNKAIEIKSLKIHTNDKMSARLALDILPDTEMRIYALPQNETEEIIRQGLEALGGKVLYGTTLQQLSQDEQNVSVIINGKREKFDYVVGADGINSKTRQSLGLEFSGYDLEEDWSIADFETQENYGADHFNIFFLPFGKAVILIPLAHQKNIYRYRAVSSSNNALEALPLALEDAKVNRAASFKIKIAQVEQYQKGRVFLAGDAAHCHSPVGGRGMNLGISDAADLARRFQEGGLKDYHHARHAEGKKTIQTTERARKFLMSDSWWKRRFFISMIKTAQYIRPLQEIILRNVLNEE